jgi:lipopolysaccharide/colanic/teichoic acid biosynthesis glycosyltransferase
MYINKENNSLLTVGNDKRITRVGKVLRKTKLDELPQLFNILKGDMSFVGPRPEVPEYVKYYTEEQRKVLSIRPGLTDYASLYFINEAEILANAQNPEEYYIKEIIPKKISLSLKYVEKPTIWNDFVILAKTFFKILRLN